LKQLFSQLKKKYHRGFQSRITIFEAIISERNGKQKKKGKEYKRERCATWFACLLDWVLWNKFLTLDFRKSNQYRRKTPRNQDHGDNL
jgi:hypothetical protein